MEALGMHIGSGVGAPRGLGVPRNDTATALTMEQYYCTQSTALASVIELITIRCWR